MDGDVGDALLGHARTVAADLVVMTTHGRGASSRFWLGRVTDRYLRTTQGPVLVVKREYGRTVKEEGGLGLRKIVVPLDGSEGSEKALAVATSMARLTDAELGLLQVVELPTLPHATSDIDLVGPEGSQVERAESYLIAVAEGIAPGTVVSTTEVRSHIKPAVAILDFVLEWSGDLVVMCTRGLGVARRLFLGGVTDKVVRDVTVPVLVVPHQDE